ncbi:MAG: hypothetical protein DRP13_02360 [Candidatus Aenigmatarchaeota archaeon]|nr:MAG: hypothetical protein DRP13_02360 [Candidatus Aenigmarchaeota archaeon]
MNESWSKGCITCNHKEYRKLVFIKICSLQGNSAEEDSQKEANTGMQDTNSQRKQSSFLLCSTDTVYPLTNLRYPEKEIQGQGFTRTICKRARRFGDIKHIIECLNITFGKLWRKARCLS